MHADAGAVVGLDLTHVAMLAQFSTQRISSSFSPKGDMLTVVCGSFVDLVKARM